ncbi:hypothetical protein [Actinoallomurus sp. CA-150999]|uniref:hypothetical protein n=1 Tax=Actinoallomurus sp. CA-150999 TaxID=3239887 RepID=UPI003D902901
MLLPRGLADRLPSDREHGAAAAHGALGNNITGWAFTGGMLEADFSNMASSAHWTVASDVDSNPVYTC